MAEVLRNPEDLKKVPRGQRGHFVVPVARRIGGGTIDIHVHVVQGDRPGPTLGLIANIHGDAVYGARIVSTWLERADTDFAGTVIAIPVANPVAFESATRTTGQGWNTDMNNMNRVFPGDAGGWITQKLAAAVAENFVTQIDAMIDYHCGGGTSIDYTLVNGDQTPEQKRVFDYCRLMATDFIFVHDKDPFSGTIDQYAKSLGKLSIVAEQGGNVLPDGFLELSMTRIDNFMKGLGMKDGEPDFPESQLLMRPPRVLPRIDHQGIYIPVQGVEVLSKVVDGGTLLGQVVDPATLEVVQEIRAPYEKSAICMARTSFGRVNPGDYAFIISDATRAEVIGRPDNWRIEL